jgi:fructokinase
MPDIITVGELLIDLTQTFIDDNRVRHYAANPGGAPANVAVAAARLGAKAGFIGKVGRDTFGADLRAVLVRSGVDVSGLYETGEALTTQAVVSVAPSGERSFSFYRSPGADTLLTVDEVAAALADPPKVVHFGSVSLTAEPARSATLAAGELAKQGGALVSYDPNYRANLWPDEETAVAWMKKPLPMVDVLKISDEELPLLTGTDDPEKGTAELAKLGIRLILVTLGSKGVFYRMGEAVGAIGGIKVKVADTNGAGDTFLGALLSRLVLRGEKPLEGLTPGELEEMLSFANRAAALTCTRSGAIPAMPTKEEVENGI